MSFEHRRIEKIITERSKCKRLMKDLPDDLCKVILSFMNFSEGFKTSHINKNFYRNFHNHHKVKKLFRVLQQFNTKSSETIPLLQLQQLFTMKDLMILTNKCFKKWPVIKARLLLKFGANNEDLKLLMMHVERDTKTFLKDTNKKLYTNHDTTIKNLPSICMLITMFCVCFCPYILPFILSIFWFLFCASYDGATFFGAKNNTILNDICLRGLTNPGMTNGILFCLPLISCLMFSCLCTLGSLCLAGASSSPPNYSAESSANCLHETLHCIPSCLKDIWSAEWVKKSYFNHIARHLNRKIKRLHNKNKKIKIKEFLNFLFKNLDKF